MCGRIGGRSGLGLCFVWLGLRRLFFLVGNYLRIPSLVSRSKKGVCDVSGSMIMGELLVFDCGKGIGVEGWREG